VVHALPKWISNAFTSHPNSHPNGLRRGIPNQEVGTGRAERKRHVRPCLFAPAQSDCFFTWVNRAGALPYCFLCRRLAVSPVLIQEKTEMNNPLHLALIGEENQATWSIFMFGVTQAQSLGQLPREDALRLLGFGACYTGRGWTTSRASKALFELTNVPLVASEVSAYRNGWLFAVAMLWDIGLNGDLSDRAAEGFCPR